MSSDLQARLTHIESQAHQIESRNAASSAKVNPLEMRKDVRDLASLVNYLAKVVKKHLETKER